MLIAHILRTQTSRSDLRFVIVHDAHVIDFFSLAINFTLALRTVSTNTRWTAAVAAPGQFVVAVGTRSHRRILYNSVNILAAA
jgi:hypothetical protein